MSFQNDGDNTTALDADHLKEVFLTFRHGHAPLAWTDAQHAGQMMGFASLDDQLAFGYLLGAHEDPDHDLSLSEGRAAGGVSSMATSI